MTGGLKLDDLSDEEMAVVRWQYRMNGGFYTSLWDAITKADDVNLNRLAYGFPAEVEGYILYTRTAGWWPEVQRKIGARD